VANPSDFYFYFFNFLPILQCCHIGDHSQKRFSHVWL
jgi:hypothetical protein